MNRKAYAKINLGLDVLGRYPNGYHEVKMVMQMVNIWDELEFEKTQEGITIVTDNKELPTGEENLVYKACRLMFEEYGLEGGVRITLNKNIPIAAGMAGGSTDAAAALKGICSLYGLNPDEEKLREIGLKIGADVPYCIMGGTALAEGIGEKLTRIRDMQQCILLVVKPDVNVSTKYVYEHLDALESYEHLDIDGMVKAIGNDDLSGVVSRLGNVLEAVTIPRYPVVGELKQIMMENGAKGSIMSGSGPSVFGVFEREEAARKTKEIMEEKGLAKQIFITNPVKG